MSRRVFAFTLLCVLAAVVPLQAADVHVIAPGTDTGVVQGIIDGAGEGDILLIQTGTTLGTLVIDGKGVGLVGDGLPRPRIVSLEVSNVPAGSTVSLRNLEVRPSSGNPFFVVAAVTAITVTNCAGGVLIEDCVVPAGGVFLNPFPVPGPALVVEGSDVVSVSRCVLYGADGPSQSADCGLLGPGLPGKPAMVVTDGRVTLSATALAGGVGGSSWDCPGALGGTGVVMDGASFVVLSGSDVQGGVSGVQTFPPSGGGGPWWGLTAPAGARVWKVDSTVSSVNAPPSVVVDFDVVGTEARTFSVTAPLRENQGGSLDFTGKQGDMVAIMWSFTTSWFEILGNRNAFIPGFAPVLGGPIILGPNPAADGQWSIPIKGPGLPPGIDGQFAVMQAFVQDPLSFEIVLTGTTTYVLVDDVF